jgi:hypothetical protein
MWKFELNFTAGRQTAHIDRLPELFVGFDRAPWSWTGYTVCWNSAIVVSVTSKEGNWLRLFESTDKRILHYFFCQEKTASAYKRIYRRFLAIGF